MQQFDQRKYQFSFFSSSLTISGIKSLLIILLLLVVDTVTSVASAVTAANVKNSVTRVESDGKTAEKLFLPYLFSTDSMGLNIGAGALFKGYHQEQMAMGATVFGGEVSKGVGLGLLNYRLPFSKRLFFSAYGMYAYFPDQRAYAGGSLTYIPQEIPLPGSNSSSKEQYLEADGASDWFDFKLEYALPFGATKERGMVQYKLENGLLISKPSGGKEWNPLTSGASVLVFRQFNRYQDFEFEDGIIDGTIHGMEFGLLYDNTDFSINPSTGSRQYIAYSHDAGWFESEHTWNFVALDMSKFFSFGASDYAHQRILAFNFWTGYSPSWELLTDDTGARTVINNAPYNEGATLGGFYRLRGYDQHRFHDKAAIYGAVEYRYTLKYNPIEDINWLRFLKLDWFQLVGFAEVGRVGASYSANELLTDMKYDVGGSIRALVAGLVVRIDIAQSAEGVNAWFMVDQPF